MTDFEILDHEHRWHYVSKLQEGISQLVRFCKLCDRTEMKAPTSDEWTETAIVWHNKPSADETL